MCNNKLEEKYQIKVRGPRSRQYSAANGKKTNAHYWKSSYFIILYNDDDNPRNTAIFAAVSRIAYYFYTTAFSAWPVDSRYTLCCRRKCIRQNLTEAVVDNCRQRTSTNTLLHPGGCLGPIPVGGDWRVVVVVR